MKKLLAVLVAVVAMLGLTTPSASALTRTACGDIGDSATVCVRIGYHLVSGTTYEADTVKVTITGSKAGMDYASVNVQLKTSGGSVLWQGTKQFSGTVWSVIWSPNGVRFGQAADYNVHRFWVDGQVTAVPWDFGGNIY